MRINNATGQARSDVLTLLAGITPAANTVVFFPTSSSATASGSPTLAGLVLTQDTLANILAATPTAGLIRNASDIGITFKGDGTRWRPIGGTGNVYLLPAPVTSVASTETIFAQYLLPAANLFQTLDRLRLFWSWSKTGTTNVLSARIRIGTTGTIASDTLVFNQTALTAANRSGGWMMDHVFNSATSIQRKGAGVSMNTYQTTNANAANAAVTIPSAATNQLYLTFTGISDGSTDTMGLEDLFVQLVSKP